MVLRDQRQLREQKQAKAHERETDCWARSLALEAAEQVARVAWSSQDQSVAFQTYHGRQNLNFWPLAQHLDTSSELGSWRLRARLNELWDVVQASRTNV